MPASPVISTRCVSRRCNGQTGRSALRDRSETLRGSGIEVSLAELTEAKRRATQANRQVAVRREANTLKPGAISEFSEIVKAEGEQAAAAAAVRTAEEVAYGAKCNLDLHQGDRTDQWQDWAVPGHVGNLVTADNTLLATIVSVNPMCVTFAVDMRTVLRIRRMMREDKGKGEGQPALSVLCGLADDKGFPYRGQVESRRNLRSIRPPARPIGGQCCQIRTAFSCRACLPVCG